MSVVIFVCEGCTHSASWIYKPRFSFHFFWLLFQMNSQPISYGIVMPTFYFLLSKSIVHYGVVQNMWWRFSGFIREQLQSVWIALPSQFCWVMFAFQCFLRVLQCFFFFFKNFPLFSFKTFTFNNLSTHFFSYFAWLTPYSVGWNMREVRPSY